MAKKHKRNCSIALVILEMQIKTITHLEELKLERLTIPSVGDHVNQYEPSQRDGGKVMGHNYLENSLAISQKLNIFHTPH